MLLPVLTKNSGPTPRSSIHPAFLTTTSIALGLSILSTSTAQQQNIDFPLPLPTNHGCRDPSIILHNDYYYLFSTSSQLSYWRASNLSGPWQPAGSVLPRRTGSIIDKGNPRQPWAPTIIQQNDTFYCFYCVSTIDTRNSSIGVATSTSLDEGAASSWTDHGAIINTLSGENADVSPYNDSNAIDPSVIIDPVTGGSGQAWLTFGSYWSDIWQVPLSSDLLSVANADSPNATHVAFNATFPAEEASFVSYEAPWYYLWYSKGYCCGMDIDDLPAAGTEYSIQVGRSLDVSGPYLDKENVSLVDGGGSIIYGSNHDGQVYAPGSSGVLSSDVGKDVLYYHYLNLSIGVSDGDAILGYNYLDYEDGWPVVSSIRPDNSNVQDMKSAASNVLSMQYFLNSCMVLCSLWLL